MSVITMDHCARHAADIEYIVLWSAFDNRWSATWECVPHMPIYEYRCEQCAHSFEYLLLRLSAPAECPVCASRDLEQLISACAVSSESTQQANLRAVHGKVAAARGDRLRQQHQHLHEHFEDGGASPRESHATDGVKGNE
jgi:putative FmdB family regulatory protein